MFSLTVAKVYSRYGGFWARVSNTEGTGRGGGKADKQREPWTPLLTHNLSWLDIQSNKTQWVRWRNRVHLKRPTVLQRFNRKYSTKKKKRWFHTHVCKGFCSDVAHFTVRRLRLLARLRSQVLKRFDFSLLETDRKRSCAPHDPGECSLSQGEGGGVGRFGPSQPHPWTPRQSSPPDLKDRKNTRLKRSALWIGANESQRCRGAIQEERVYLKHDNSWNARHPPNPPDWLLIFWETLQCGQHVRRAAAKISSAEHQTVCDNYSNEIWEVSPPRFFWGLAGREVKLETIRTALRKHLPSAGEQKGNLTPITRWRRVWRPLQTLPLHRACVITRYISGRNPGKRLRPL